MLKITVKTIDEVGSMTKKADEVIVIVIFTENCILWKQTDELPTEIPFWF